MGIALKKENRKYIYNNYRNWDDGERWELKKRRCI
jgi:hypothetical protein